MLTMYDFPAIINETERSKGAIKADKNETNLGRMMMMIMMRVEMKMLKLIFSWEMDVKNF